MSVTRRLNRENKRIAQKSNRQIDWAKIKKTSNTLFIVCVSFFVVIFSLTSYVVNAHNTIRKKVLGNPMTTTGKIISISIRKGVHSATYEFNDKEKRYSGSTFSSYKGVIGDNICIEYSLDNPNLNLLCKDIAMENIFNDSFLFSVKMLGIVIGLTVLFLILKIMTNDKKTIVELTSRKNNYR